MATSVFKPLFSNILHKLKTATLPRIAMALVLFLASTAQLLATEIIVTKRANRKASKTAPPKSGLKLVCTYVNPFICTAGDHGQLDPAATLPFGMAKPGPETTPTNHGGYDYNAKLMLGFSQLRTNGTGCKGAGGNILIRPCEVTDTAQSVAYDKPSENAGPGYYSVKLQNPSVSCELTASRSVSVYRFKFSGAGRHGIMVNLNASHEKLIEQHTDYTPGTSLTGFVSAGTVCNKGAYKVYFAFDYDSRPEALIPLKPDGRFIMPFNLKADSLQVRIALSSISEKDAREKLFQEVNKRSFDKIKEQADALWEKTLGAVQISGTNEQKTLFYTHLYHSLLSPVQIQNAKGLCRGTDGKIRIDPGQPQYSLFSTWDNFRTEMPLLALLYPDTMSGIARSMAWLYREGKNNWANATEPYPTVRTEHSLVTMLDCLKKGINGFDLNTLYPLIVADTINFPLKTADNYLETAYDYWALAGLAKLANKPYDAAKFYTRSLCYEPIWKEKLMPITDKSDIMHGGGIYEGTPWQYRWFVPHNIKGIQGNLGDSVFTAQLEYFFDHELYNHGNQPDIQTPWLFNFTAKPWLTQKVVNSILSKPINHWYGTHNKWKAPVNRKTYLPTREGYIPEMDDDAGTMSGWYVLGAMGLYPACVGEPQYLISSPLLQRTSFKLASGKMLVISAPNASDNNVYIQSLTWNGKPWNTATISHAELMKGGKLEFVLGPKPNKNWGTVRSYIPSVEADLKAIGY